MRTPSDTILHQSVKDIPPLIFDWVWHLYSNITRAINGNLTFGTALNPDNIAGKWVSYATNAVANTEDAIPHNFGVVPTGFILMIPPQNGFIYSGTTAWTTTDIYLKCSAAAQTARIFILLPPLT